MSLLIEDSPRNLLRWIIEAVTADGARGAVITPFASPRADVPYRRGAETMAAALHDANAEVWFDPTTHGLQMPNVGDFRYYDTYDLWPAGSGDLWTPADQFEHVRRVFSIQDHLGVPHLAPAILLHHGVSETSQSALELSQSATQLDDQCWLSIAGTSPFWSSSSALDAHIGALAQLEPAGWFLSVARHVAVLPGDASHEEVYGLCRTVRALSEYAPVYISHGDLASLPAVAAGALSVGTGWDPRQRVCAFSSYAARDPGGAGGGGWYERPTLPGLVGSLTPNEAAILDSVDPAMAHRLGPLPPPGPQEAFTHHLDVMNRLVGDLTGLDPESAYRSLMNTYRDAQVDWPTVVAATASPLGAESWITPFAAGLGRYGADEGW
jgi:hypothetical protein